MKRRFPIIKHAKVWVAIGFIAIVASVYLFVSNINTSIEFTGGVQAQTNVALTQEAVQADLGPKLQEQGFGESTIKVESKPGISTLTVQVDVDNQEKVQGLSNLILDYIKSQDGEVLSQSITGASVGDYLSNSAEKAIILGIIGIAIYMMFAFAAVKDIISPVILAIIVLFTLIFDLAVPAGAYGLLMASDATVQVDLVFIAAILTVMGYSINDTIVIFDRVRENMHIHETSLKSGKMTYLKIFEDSLWQTMRRSLITAISTVIMIICMWIFGTGVIKIFAFIMGTGIIAGTFSSIFLSATLAYLFVKWTKKRA